MDTASCPGCRGALGLDQEVCPHCRRPRDAEEMERGRALAAEKIRDRRRRPYRAAAWILLAAALALGYRARAALRGPAVFLKGRILFVVSLGRHSLDSLKNEVHQDMDRVQSDGGTGRPTAEFDLKSAALPAEIPPGKWGLKGVVYDLSTLAPAPGVALNFQAVQGWGKTASDARGAYAVVLPRVDGGGFDPTTIDARFLPSVLHESDIPYATLSPSERADLAQSAAGGDMASTPVDGSPSATVVVRDLFVVRRSTDR